MTKELKKITWISNKEAVRKSLMVIGVCLAAALVIYAVDTAALLVLGKAVGM